MNGAMLSGSVGLDSLQSSLNTRTNHMIGKFDSQIVVIGFTERMS